MAMRLITLGLLVAGCLAVPAPLTIDPTTSWRVIGGSEAPDGAFPYQISLQLNGRHSCGGTIVDSQYVITAAHCVTGSTTGLTVVAGSNKLSVKGDVYKVIVVHSHAEYDPWNLINDVAILKVQPITFNDKVSKIKAQHEDLGGDVPVTLSGWGSTRLGGPAPDNLQFVDLKTTTVEFCDSEHSRKVYDTQICTLTKKGEGACHGDSGGPLVAHNGEERILAGIVSWGQPCARGKPDVFSRVSSFIDWFNLRCQKCLN